MQSLGLTTKTEELKQLEYIFLHSQSNKIINLRLKEIAKIEISIEMSNLNYSRSR